MEKKKTFVEKLNADAVGLSTIFVGAITGAVLPAVIGYNAAQAVEKKFDVNAHAQSAYEQKVDTAVLNLENQTTIMKAIGNLPENFNIDDAKAKLLQFEESRFKKEALIEATAAKKQEKADNRKLGFWGGCLLTVVGAAIGGLFSDKVRRKVKDEQNKAEYERDKEDTNV